jgi:TetR/AcrR family transcriptional regulator
MQDGLETDLKALVDEKAAVIRGWIAEGRIADVDPHHLIFSIWALTQHYADFDVQVRAVLGPKRDPLTEAETFLDTLFTRLLAP